MARPKRSLKKVSLPRKTGKIKVVFCSAEVAPFAKTGGLGDVCGALPIALEKQGIEPIIVMPLYRWIDRKKFNITKDVRGIYSTTIGKDIPVYFIESKFFFDREGIYGGPGSEFTDNFERYLYLCHETLALLKQIKFKADIVSCHDWHTALIPAFLKFRLNKDPFYKDMKSIFTIHNIAYQGVFPSWNFMQLGLPDELFNIHGFEFYDDINLLKAGIVYSDEVTTVSPTHSKEIYQDENGWSLAGVLRARTKPVVGILNGIDYDIWNPQTDELIAKTFSDGSTDGKSVNKQKLQVLSGLMARPRVPLFGFVGRLSTQKGLSLIADALEDLMKLDIQMVFLGVGDEHFVRTLNAMTHRFPNKVSFHHMQDEKVAHLIYAGSDLFLMPSMFEPCGLSQMIALRYGTIPVVYKTGGLADTIKPFNSPHGNGFVFEKYSREAFLSAVKTAVEAYGNKNIFPALIERAFQYDFSWENSAKDYIKLYEQCLS